ncbi:MAG: Gmad2 immunoglobulin-like domain-containing protein [bacterium]|nr:Gmad2 immunoglobulin-like domain-containing protein [bacterium]
MYFRAIVFIVVVIVVLIIGYNLYQLYPSESAPVPQEEEINEPEEGGQTYAVLDKADLIKVENLKPNQTITSPLIIKGEARGYWFFEASFPVKLLDDKENLIALQVATAQSEWMTEDFVPFEAVVEFEAPVAGKGILVFEKDNPSGLPENADELRIPVSFD